MLGARSSTSKTSPLGICAQTDGLDDETCRGSYQLHECHANDGIECNTVYSYSLNVDTFRRYVWQRHGLVCPIVTRRKTSGSYNPHTFCHMCIIGAKCMNEIA